MVKRIYGSPRGRSEYWIRPLIRAIVRLRLIWIILLAVLCLSGCVQSNSEIKFYSPTHGEIVQHLRLADSLTALNRKPIQQWLTKLERQARQLQGRAKLLDEHDLTITLPFFNGADLERKFNQLFATAIEGSFLGIDQTDVAKPEAYLRLQQSNFLLLQRNHLIYDIDLTSLGLSGTDDLAGANALLKLEFALQTPWILRPAHRGIEPRSSPEHTLVWSLQPGQENHLEAFFWLPDPLGIGTVVIVLLVIGGAKLKSLMISASASEESQSSVQAP